MQFLRRRFLHLALALAAVPAFACGASSQTYPSRPVTIVVPYLSGGPTDTLARILADHIRTSLGQTVIIVGSR